MKLMSKFLSFSWHWYNHIFFNSNKTYVFSTKMVFQMNVLFFSRNLLNFRRHGKWMTFSNAFQKDSKIFFLPERPRKIKLCDSSQTANNKGNWLAFCRSVVFLFWIPSLLGLITQSLSNYWKPFNFVCVFSFEGGRKVQEISFSIKSPGCCISLFSKNESKFFHLIPQQNFFTCRRVLYKQSHFFDLGVSNMIRQLLHQLVTYGVGIWKNLSFLKWFEFQGKYSLLLLTWGPTSGNMKRTKLYFFLIVLILRFSCFTPDL